MAKMIKVGTQSGPIEGEEVDFKAVSEPWCVYQLGDGYAIRLKLVMTQVIKTNQKDADGNPVYIARSSNVIAVSPPETYNRGEVQ